MMSPLLYVRLFCVVAIIYSIAAYYHYVTIIPIIATWWFAILLTLTTNIIRAFPTHVVSIGTVICVVLGVWNAYLVSHSAFYRVGAYIWGAAALVVLVASFIKSVGKLWFEK